MSEPVYVRRLKEMKRTKDTDSCEFVTLTMHRKVKCLECPLPLCLSDILSDKAYNTVEQKLKALRLELSTTCPKGNGHRRKGRPKIIVNLATLLSLRASGIEGYGSIAKAYREKTGQYVSRETIKRRLRELKGEFDGD